MVELTTRVRVIRPAVAVTALVAFIGGFTAIGAAKHTPLAALLGIMVSVIGGIMLYRLAKTPPPAAVRVDAQGVAIGGVLVIPRADVTDAQFVPVAKDGPHVLVKGKGRSATIVVSGPEEGARILRELEMDVGAHAAEFSVVAPSALPVFAGIVLGLAVMMFGLFAKMTPLAVLGPLLAVLAPFLLVPATLRVGTDGVLLKSRLQEKFFPLERIAAVSPTRNGIKLDMIDGTSTSLPIASTYSLGPYDKEVQAAMLQRLHEARMRRAGAPASAEATVGWRLGRGERTIAEWLASLAGEGAEGAGGFRDAEIRLEDLVEVLDDRAGAPAHERVAAAVLLAKRGGDEERARIRVAAEAVVAPKLRVALDAIADGKDAAALEEAIREAEEEASVSGTKRAV